MTQPPAAGNGGTRSTPGRRLHLPGGRTVEAWTEVTEVTEVTGAVVSFTHHYALPLPGTATRDALQIREPGPSSSENTPGSENQSGSKVEELQSSGTLRFRSEIELRASLTAYGFRVEQVHGGWRREPVGAGDGELVVLARAR